MLHAIITRFGLPAVLAGSGVEGEPFALMGGILAHRAAMPLWAAIAAAMTGAFAVDLFWFMLGRRCRAHRWVRAAQRRRGFARSIDLIERHATLAILLFRFAYGLRAVAPIAVGTSRIPARRFVVVGAAAAALWGSAFTLAGYCFGAVLGPWAGDFALIGAMLGVALLVGGAMRGRRSAGAAVSIGAEG